MKFILATIVVLLIGLGGFVMFGNRMSKDPFEEVGKEYERLQEREDLSVATLAGGCFWCMEGPFEAMEGVEEVIAGYTGGTSNNPTYNEVASGQTDY